MIYFEDLPLEENILEALSELEIDYVFQPIFHRDGKTVYAYEALMRPLHKTVTELIEEYTERDELHTLEVATFWGATQAYFLRGYKERLAVNSFPCECFTMNETKAYIDYFGGDKDRLIIEMLEYPEFSIDMSAKKKYTAAIGGNKIAIDDFGTGFNHIDKVEMLDPEIIKIDRSLLSDIDSDPDKQANCKDIIDTMHCMGKIVVAEGVETKEEFDYLHKLGADLFQGYYLARPA